MRFVRFIQFFLLSAIAVAIAIGNISAQTAEPIEAIAAFNLTGPEAVLDAPCYKGVELAVKQLNARGGVLGRPIQLIPVDTASDVDSAASKVRSVLKKHPATIAGIGFSYSTYALKVGRVFQKADLPFITPGATAPDLPEKVGDNMFLAAYGDNAQAQVMAQYAKDKLGLQNVSLWIDDSRVYTQTIGKFFEQYFRQLGGTINKHTYPKNTIDFQDLIEDFQSADPMPEAIFAASMPRSSIDAIEQIRNAGINVPLLSGDGWDDAEIINMSKQEEIKDLYFTTHRFLGVDTPEMDTFIKDYTETYGAAPPNAFAPLGFDSLNLLADAILRANSVAPDKIRTSLAKTQDFEGLVGTISYPPGIQVPNKAVVVIQVDKGTEKPIWTWIPDGRENSN